MASRKRKQSPWFTVTGLSRVYRRGPHAITALHPVDLALETGERVALVGPSGSGKTTLLGLLAGLDRPTAGEVLVDGRSLGRLTSNDLAAYRRTTIGFLFQSARLLDHLSALENVALPLLLAGVPRSAREQRAVELLERIGLVDRAHHRPAELSGGEQQRIALARALANQPRLLLADEPTAGLDHASASDITSWLFGLVEEQSLTLVVATHDLELARRCDRQLSLDRARALERAA